ncbi:MAG TPA: DUF924 family protein [Stellaceae bacterium]|nr:DUF924 family protein [Stellaceae bacterium]
MNADEEKRIEALLGVWFGLPGTPDYDRPRQVWFTVDPAFDALLRERFQADQTRAASGGYDHWAAARDPALALVLLLDQLPRNLYRGTAQAYASDAKARSVARLALAQGFDAAVSAVRRGFFYLPFEHSEDLADQELSLRLFGALHPEAERDSQLRYARRHRDIIARFGRFPHRNAALGRATTAAEAAFLQEPDSSF